MPNKKSKRNNNNKTKNDKELAYKRFLREKRKAFKEDVKASYEWYTGHLNCKCCKGSGKYNKIHATYFSHIYNNKLEEAEKTLEHIREYESDALTYFMEHDEHTIFVQDKFTGKILHQGKANNEGIRQLATNIKDDMEDLTDCLTAYKCLYIDNYL